MGVLIGLSGKKQSGKSTIASFLRQDKGFFEVSWAEPLKTHIGKDLFGFTEEQVNGTEAEKEAVDPRWGKSPRWVLQHFGTEVFRSFDPDFWVKVGTREIADRLDQGYDVVVADCRFPNEMEAVRRLGGIAVRVVRMGQVSKDTHVSETALDTYEFDRIITARSGDLTGLLYTADQLVKDMRDGLMATRDEIQLHQAAIDEDVRNGVY